MMKKAFFEMTSVDAQYLRHHADISGTFFSPDTFDAARLENPAQCVILSVFVNSQLNADALQSLPNLKMIATRSTGYDHIDLDYCRSHGISVSNVPVYGDNTVAEHTFALILALSRKIIQSHSRARAADFSFS